MSNQWGKIICTLVDVWRRIHFQHFWTSHVATMCRFIYLYKDNSCFQTYHSKLHQTKCRLTFWLMFPDMLHQTFLVIYLHSYVSPLLEVCLMWPLWLFGLITNTEDCWSCPHVNQEPHFRALKLNFLLFSIQTMSRMKKTTLRLWTDLAATSSVGTTLTWVRHLLSSLPSPRSCRPYWRTWWVPHVTM